MSAYPAATVRAALDEYALLHPELDIDRVMHLAAARGLPDACPDGVPCCDGYGYLGYEYCTCWEPVFGAEQYAPRRIVAPEDCPTRERMCGTCAFRPGSPERRDDPDARHDSELLRSLVAGAGYFWCHDGMRKVVAMRHPNGMRVDWPLKDTDVEAFQPPTVNGVPYQADGSPGIRCAGLAAARRAKDWTP